MDGLEEAQKDFLTGFYNREYLISTLLKRIIDAKLRKEKLSILLIDIDHFKRINDKHGHLWGDEFLKYVASTLRLTLENKGLIFRYGGDEFVVIFSTSSPKEAYLLARQFNLVMKNRPFLFNGRLFKITISCGLATCPDDASSAEALLKAADQALYFSKRFGRNTTTCVSRIKLQRFKMAIVVLLELSLIFGLGLLVHRYVYKGLFGKTLKSFAISRLLPVKVKADTKIVLRSGDVVLGRVISEDQEKLVVEVSLGQGSCTMNVEKAQVQDIIPIQDTKKP